MKLDNFKRSSKLIQKLMHCSGMLKLRVAKIEERWVKEHLPETKGFLSTFLCHEIKVGLERQARQELLSWIFYCAPEWLRPLCFYEKLLRSRNSLVMIWNKVAILKWNNHPILRILLWQNYLWSHWNKPIFSIVFFISSSALQPDLMFDKSVLDHA